MFLLQFKKYAFYIFLTLFLFCTGCQNNSSEKGQEAFENFTYNIFVEEVQSDAISLNYTLANPENYGITEYNTSFGEFSIEDMQSAYAKMENYLTALNEFSYKDLTKEQQLTYDVFKQYLELELSSTDYMLYSNVLGPNTGLQAQLPVLLSEYHFNDKEDIEIYLLLLEDLPRYFKQIADFEEKKSKAGLFMSDETANSIITQCQNFIKSKEDNVIIEVFNDRIDTIDFLSKEEIKKYKEQNKTLVFDYVIPAYELLIEQLEALKGTGTNNGGLCHFPN